jgi:hypothetical protein
MKPAGYSGTPLAKKLGFAEGLSVHVSGAPEGYDDLIGDTPGIVWRRTPGTRLDLAHVFLRERSRLEKALPKFLKAVAPNGAIWVSWPKRVSGVKTDITEDVIREIALPLGLVDVKVCAVDDVWSGLKLVIRKELRSRRI